MARREPTSFTWRGKVRSSSPPQAGWIVVDFLPGKTHSGGRMAYGPWRSSRARAVAADAWRRDPLVQSVLVFDAKPPGVVTEIAVRG